MKPYKCSKCGGAEFRISAKKKVCDPCDKAWHKKYREDNKEKRR